MRRYMLPACLSAAGLWAPPAHPAPLPPPVVAMIDAAAGDPGQLAAVVKAAKATNPASLAEIDAQVSSIHAAAAARRKQALANQGLFDGWSGQGQAGGFLSSGNSDSVGVSVGLALAKTTLSWRHEFKVSADYQRSDGAVSKERYAGAYSGRRSLGPRAFAALSLSAERDRFAGIHSRFSEGVGLGYRLVDRPGLKLNVDGGPALRQIDYATQPDVSEVAGRMAGDLTWAISPVTTFTQTAQAYLAAADSTFTATSALTTRIDAALSARTSFDLRYETDPAAGRKATDTTSRVTLVYSF